MTEVCRHTEASGRIAAEAGPVFERLDDQTRLAQHMKQSSMMMGGGRMTYEFDGGQGRAVGSHIKMGGQAFGLSLFVDEVVSEREPPRRKVWHTVGVPHLLVIASYTMGFELAPDGRNTNLRVWIDYELPATGLHRWLGVFFGGIYARWCVRRMVFDAMRHFAKFPVAVNAAAD